MLLQGVSCQKIASEVGNVGRRPGGSGHRGEVWSWRGLHVGSFKSGMAILVVFVNIRHICKEGGWPISRGLDSIPAHQLAVALCLNPYMLFCTFVVSRVRCIFISL